MGKALDRIAAVAHSRTDRARDWRKGMSDHVAWALLVYTGLHIFVTVKAVQETGYTMLALMGLVALVAAIIPLWRWFERRWTKLDDAAAHDPSLASAYRRDTLLIWAAAIGLPVGLTALFKALLGG